MTEYTINYLTDFIQFLVLLPGAILCFLPMRDQLRVPAKRLAVYILAFVLAAAAVCPLIRMHADVTYNTLLLPLLVLAFLLYSRVLKSPMEMNLTVFLLVMTLMSFTSNFATAIDAYMRPTGTVYDESMIFTVSQLVISGIFLLFFGPFFAMHLRKLVNLTYIRRPWLLFSVLTLMILALNIYIVPQQYETLQVNRMFRVYIFSQVFFLLVLTILYGIFFIVIREIDRAASDRTRLEYLEMQESQYHSQQLYMEETSRLRHDFRQQLNAMTGMARNKEYDELSTYIMKLSRGMPEQLKTWCGNAPLNALFNHYASIMESQQIHMNWNIGMPDVSGIPDIELCSLIGNMLENAYYGCLTVPEEQRWHDLMIRPEGTRNLFIISGNSFDGKVKKKDGVYLSTRRQGSGIGLASIRRTAEIYGGAAKFSNTDHEFRTDVILPYSE